MHPKLHRSSIKLFISGDLKKVEALMGIYFELLSSKMSIKFLDDASCQIFFFVCVCVCVRERERRERQRERDRERQRETERQTDRQKKIGSC